MTKTNSWVRLISGILVLGFFAQEISYAAPGIQPVDFSFIQGPILGAKIPQSIATIEDTLRLPSDLSIILLQDALGHHSKKRKNQNDFSGRRHP